MKCYWMTNPRDIKGIDVFPWALEAYEKLNSQEPLDSNAAWALTLQPGQKVLTKWDDRVPEYSSAVPWEHKDSDVWNEVTIRNTWKDKTCGSGVLVSFQELPDNWEYQFDSSWIKPLEVTNEA